MRIKQLTIPFLFSCLFFLASFSSQAQSNEITMYYFAETGEFDKYSEWKQFSYDGGITLEARTAILTNEKKGCSLGVEIKNTHSKKISGTLVFFNEFGGTTPMPEMIKYSVKPGETVIITHTAKYCGPELTDNSYANCFSACIPAYHVLVD